MLDSEGYERFLRQKISLERKLEDIGDFRGSAEVESQMMFIQERLTARITQAQNHAAQEMNGLRMVLAESIKD
jgi:hypothetical protein